MTKQSTEQETIWIVTGDALATRGSGPKQLKVEELSVNVTIFLNQMGSLLEKAPENIGSFQFDEFEVHAEVTAQGTIAVLGSGMQAGYVLCFVARTCPTTSKKTKKKIPEHLGKTDQRVISSS